MNILLVYPENPVTYWGFQYALNFIHKKSAFPPLGLLTVASILPDKYNKRLIDMNTDHLTDRDIAWADYVFISAMNIQRESVRNIVSRCKKLGVKTVAGGPLFTFEYDAFGDIDHLLLSEGEITIPEFINDLERGTARHLYTTDDKADMSLSPVPSWDLINVKKYASLNIQYSRGCPYNCDFCSITSLYGNIPRTKSAAQLLGEMDAIYKAGWRGPVFFVDDNFIGNKKKLTEDILPAITDWMECHGYPFYFQTEASVNLSDDDFLMSAMVKAGFKSVFVGIETPDEKSLTECKKTQNKGRDLLSCVKKIHRSGLEVQGGFIVGFDSDDPSIFSRMISFIQDSGIVTAMVGLLNAPKGTKLYRRLSGEGRITDDFAGDNTNCSMNFKPKMDKDLLVEGYRKIVGTLYSPEFYYRRIMTFLKDYGTGIKKGIDINFINIIAFIKSVIRIGIIGKERFYYWKLIFWSIFRRPRVFPEVVRLSIYGFHFRKVFEKNE